MLDAAKKTHEEHVRALQVSILPASAGFLASPESADLMHTAGSASSLRGACASTDLRGTGRPHCAVRSRMLPAAACHLLLMWWPGTQEAARTSQAELAAWRAAGGEPREPSEAAQRRAAALEEALQKVCSSRNPPGKGHLEGCRAIALACERPRGRLSHTAETNHTVRVFWCFGLPWGRCHPTGRLTPSGFSGA